MRDERCEMRDARWERIDAGRWKKDERKVNRGGVNPIIEKSFRNVESPNSLFFLPVPRRNKLMHTNAVEGHLEMIPEFYSDVICIEDGMGGDIPKALRSISADKGIRADMHADIPPEAFHHSDRFSMGMIQSQLSLLLQDSGEREKGF